MKLFGRKLYTRVGMRVCHLNDARQALTNAEDDRMKEKPARGYKVYFKHCSHTEKSMPIKSIFGHQLSSEICPGYVDE